ncbi:407_t:CDS:1, partial [Paraglomus occultum]
MSESDLSSSSHASYNLTPFAIKTILKSNGMHQMASPDNVSYGKKIAEKIWNLRSSLKEQEKTLELPETLSAYKIAHPPILIDFFDDMISTFYIKRKE